MLECIRKIVNTAADVINSDYLSVVIQMHDICKKSYNSMCNHAGLYPANISEIPNLILFQESCTDSDCRFAKRDRYGYCSTIRDSSDRPLFITRHNEYPWTKLPDGERSLKYRKDIKLLHQNDPIENHDYSL